MEKEILIELMSYLDGRLENIKLRKIATNNPLLMKFYEGCKLEVEDMQKIIENKLMELSI